MKNNFAALVFIIYVLGIAQVTDALTYEFSDNSICASLSNDGYFDFGIYAPYNSE